MGKTDKTSSHRYGNGGLGTRMCVLVEPDDYEKAKKVVDRRELVV